MAIDLRTCELSRWSGRSRRCRWDDKALTGRRRHWCSDACAKAFNDNHHYTAARRATAEASRGPCDCPVDAFTSTRTTKAGQTRTVKHRAHYVCAACGRCDRDTGKLECDHITPRWGDRSSYSCLHHRTNLQMLCHADHLTKTNRQRGERFTAPSSTKGRKTPVRRTKIRPLPARRAA